LKRIGLFYTKENIKKNANWIPRKHFLSSKELALSMLTSPQDK